LSDTDVHAIGLEAAQGTYMTTASYWNMDDKTRAWSKKFFAKTSVMPTMIHTGVQGSVLHYLKAIKAAGTDDPQKSWRRCGSCRSRTSLSTAAGCARMVA
jgi:branched-chain amino acid transport system substrate-binding protein